MENFICYLGWFYEVVICSWPTHTEHTIFFRILLLAPDANLFLLSCKPFSLLAQSFLFLQLAITTRQTSDVPSWFY